MKWLASGQNFPVVPALAAELVPVPAGLAGPSAAGPTLLPHPARARHAPAAATDSVV
jgi:hypothetical protein